MDRSRDRLHPQGALVRFTKIPQLLPPRGYFHHDIFLHITYVDSNHRMPNFKRPMQPKVQTQSVLPPAAHWEGLIENACFTEGLDLGNGSHQALSIVSAHSKCSKTTANLKLSTSYMPSAPSSTFQTFCHSLNPCSNPIR